MFDVSPLNLRNEVDSAIKLNRRHTDMGWKRIRAYAGRDYRDDWTMPEDNYQGHEAGYTFNSVPNLVYNNPKVDIKGLLPVLDEAPGKAVESGLNQWIPAVAFNECLIECAYWLQFTFAVTITSLDVVPGYDDREEPLPLWPQVSVLNPMRFFQDPQGGRNGWKYRGNIWVADLDDLLSQTWPDGTPMFDPAALNEQGIEVGLEQAGVNKDAADKLPVPRRRIVGYDIFVRETGMIYTIGYGMGGSARYLREPRPYGGHRNGPYTVYGLYIVPDQVYPLPPLAVTAAKVREINAHKGQMSDDAAAAKNLILYDKSKPENGTKIARSNNNSVIGIDGLAGGFVKEAKIGGVNPANADYVERLTFELNEISGMTDQRRGNVTHATATEVEEVSQADDVRTEFSRSRFRSCVVENLQKVAHFMVHSDQVRFLIEAETPMGKVPAVYTGGMYDAATGAAQDPAFAARMRLEIQPRSMEYTDSGMMQRRAIQNTEIITQMAPAMVTCPQINWKQILDDLGESQNVSGMGERYLDQNILGAMQQQAAMAQAQEMQLAQQQGQNDTTTAQAKTGGGKKRPVSGSKKKGEPQGAAA